MGGDFCLVLKDGRSLARRGKERGRGGGESKGRVWGELCGGVLRGLVWLERRLKCRVETGLGRREPSNGGSLNSRHGVWTPCGGAETGLLLEGEMSRKGAELRKMSPAPLWNKTGPPLSSRLLSSGHLLH